MGRGLASYHVHDASDIWKPRLPTQEKGLEHEVGSELFCSETRTEVLRSKFPRHDVTITVAASVTDSN